MLLTFILDNENRDIAIAMSSSRADSVLGFKKLALVWAGWRDLNIQINNTALAEGI